MAARVSGEESLYVRVTAERRSPNFPKRGSTIGYYDLEKSVGEGNFAKVKLATHCLTGEKVRVVQALSVFVRRPRPVR
jgi:hypothetical protein